MKQVLGIKIFILFFLTTVNLLAYTINDIPNGYFTNHNSMCDSCTNNRTDIRYLQVLLNADNRLSVSLTEDGYWGRNTKNAVKSFQREYSLSPVDGWAGYDTRVKLDEVLKRFKGHSSENKPIPQITDINFPSKVKKGEYATISVTVKNGGEESNDGSITVSFPNLNYANIKDISSNTILYQKGNTIYYKNGDHKGAKYPMIELSDRSWKKNETHTLTFKIKAEKVGDFKFYIRSAMHVKGGSDWSWRNYVNTPSSSSYKDQQGWEANRYSIDVKTTNSQNPECQPELGISLNDIKIISKTGSDNIISEGEEFAIRVKAKNSNISCSSTQYVLNYKYGGHEYSNLKVYDTQEHNGIDAYSYGEEKESKSKKLDVFPGTHWVEVCVNTDKNMHGENCISKSFNVSNGNGDNRPAIPNAPSVSQGKNKDMIEIGWTPVEGDNYYQVYKSISPTITWELISTVDSKIYYKDEESLEVGINYYYRIQACNVENGCSEYSEYAYGSIAGSKYFELINPHNEVPTFSDNQKQMYDAYLYILNPFNIANITFISYKITTAIDKFEDNDRVLNGIKKSVNSAVLAVDVSGQIYNKNYKDALKTEGIEILLMSLNKLTDNSYASNLLNELEPIYSGIIACETGNVSECVGNAINISINTITNISKLNNLFIFMWDSDDYRDQLNSYRIANAYIHDCIRKNSLSFIDKDKANELAKKLGIESGWFFYDYDYELIQNLVNFYVKTIEDNYKNYKSDSLSENEQIINDESMNISVNNNSSSEQNVFLDSENNGIVNDIYIQTDKISHIIDLSKEINYLESADYSVTSSNNELVSVYLDEHMLHFDIHQNKTGMATINLIATIGESSTTQSFDVTIEDTKIEVYDAYNDEWNLEVEKFYDDFFVQSINNKLELQSYDTTIKFDIIGGNARVRINDMKPFAEVILPTREDFRLTLDSYGQIDIKGDNENIIKNPLPMGTRVTIDSKSIKSTFTMDGILDFRR